MAMLPSHYSLQCHRGISPMGYCFCRQQRSTLLWKLLLHVNSLITFSWKQRGFKVAELYIYTQLIFFQILWYWKFEVCFWWYDNIFGQRYHASFRNTFRDHFMSPANERWRYNVCYWLGTLKWSLHFEYYPYHVLVKCCTCICKRLIIAQVSGFFSIQQGPLLIIWINSDPSMGK